jgi:hypothetical protein
MTVRRHLATLAFFTVLAVVHTWPLAMAPGRWSRVDSADYCLNAWILAWVVHQAPRDPLRLFDANIFYPEPRTLAFSEHLVPQSMFAAPVLWAGGSAVLAYNVSMLAGFALTGWAMATLLTRWTKDPLAGILAGSLFAFNGSTLTRLGHIQALHNEFLPLALLALDQLLASPITASRRSSTTYLSSWSPAVRFGVCSALHALTSGYSLVFTVVANAAGTVARLPSWLPVWRSQEARARCLQLLLAAIVAAAIVTPFAVPYWYAREEQGLVRSPSEVRLFSSTGVDYVAAAGRFYMDTPLRWGYQHPDRRDVFFPGFVALTLAGVCVFTGIAWRDARARMCLAIGVTGFFLSFGPRTPVYAWLYEHVPLLQGMRAPSRFGILALFAMMALAGFGLARLRTIGARRSGSRGLAVASVVVIATAQAEMLRAPIHWSDYRGVSRVYRVVAELPHAVIAEFPFHPPGAFFRNAGYMLASTVHWKPMLNGYSGFAPVSYRRMAQTLRTFPDSASLDRLRATGVTHVIVHPNLIGGGRGQTLLYAIEATGEFERVATDREVFLFRLLPRR